MKERIVWLDTAKGIGIILVVLGHSMSPIMTGHMVMESLYKFLYMFHMPLFFFLSGVVSEKLLNAKKEQYTTLLISRSKRLMIPYIVWAVIYIPLKILMKEQVRFKQTSGLWTILLGNNPAGQLWFLYVLFILSVFTLFFVTNKNLRLFCCGGLIISVLAPIVPIRFSFPGIGLSFSLYQVGFWFCGLLASKSAKEFKGNSKIAAISSLVTLFYGAGIVFGIDLWYLKAVAAVSSCYLVCVASSRMRGIMVRLFSYLGSHSMIIYILHAPLLVIGRIFVKPLLGMIPWFYVFVLTVASISISLVMYGLIFKKVKLFRVLLFGET